MADVNNLKGDRDKRDKEWERDSLSNCIIHHCNWEKEGEIVEDREIWGQIWGGGREGERS